MQCPGAMYIVQYAPLLISNKSAHLFVLKLFIHVYIHRYMYISAKSTWDSSVGVQIPIMAHVTGRIYMPDGTNHPFEHYYNFFHFRPYHDEVQSRHYEVYRLFVCLFFVCFVIEHNCQQCLVMSGRYSKYKP